ncbi:hypothetical protein Pan44_51540 [Caulifigura coniformis]|uniref:Uncharacterized protein n=1 Tax=Caulifigura coniformis TaxID=2527983 RepID=A0A517SLU6_9PLAN|nr:hypothetical protein [Caulifigura coniformis]QDT57088.1 hypothetical protein Pan44_51540 [Caulifigura coniformis]
MDPCTMLAQADAAAADGGGALLGFLIIVGFLWAICAACNRKKSYRISGRIDEV